MRGLCGALLVLTAVVGGAAAAEWQVALSTRAPVVDGRWDPAEWAHAVRCDGLSWQGVLERRRAQGWLTATADTLFVAVRSVLPTNGELLAAVDRDTLKVVYDDAVEIWLDPTPGTPHGRTYQLLLNAKGRRGWNLLARGNVPPQPDWQGAWRVASGLADGWWTVEVAIPLAEVAPGRRATDGAWGLNFCRDWKQDWAWSCLDGGGYAPAHRFVFTADAPVVQEEQRGDPFLGRLHHALVLANPTRRPLSVRAELAIKRDVMPELKQSETLTLAPGEQREIAVRADDNSTQRFDLSARVTSADGAATWFTRDYGWRRGQPWQWTTVRKVAPPVDCQFAYYPYLHRLKVRLDVANLPRTAQLVRALCTVRPKGGAPVKTVVFDRFVDGAQEQLVELPPLRGSHELAVSLVGNGVPAGELVKPFERTVYEWERTPLGRGATVYPPFEPLRYADGAISCVLRSHRLGGFGLCDQVTAAGKPLLAGGMHFALTLDGQRAPAMRGSGDFEPGGLRPERIAYQGQFAPELPNAPVFRYRVQWDVDGLLRYDLTIPPTNGRRLDALSLEIPLRADAATHLHAMGDGIRNTLYQRLPAGEGVIWTSRKVAANDLPRGFCSYLYVGTPVRGLAWCAENDRGWSWDRAAPNVELVRSGGAVVLRVHLVNKPLVVDAPRTLTFGLQAAPIKPKLGNWRHRWQRDRYSLLGTDINWLALGDCGSVYPAGKDLHFWEMIKRGNAERLSQAEINATIERGNPLFAPYGPDKLKSWAAHVRHNLTSRYGTKMVFYYNRASYQLADEFQTFQDEWCKTDWRTVGPGRGIGEIAIVPSPSYIDHALWWYARSCELGGNRGVYWDNWFFQGTYNTQMTAAYRDETGAIVPSTGIWGLRELSRRTFQMLNEQGLTPITMPHMTSTNILPLHGFATVQYDWEWKYSEGDVQDRFSREYILLVSNGDLAGTWPVLLGDHGKLAQDPWTQRTFAAVCLLHELDGYGVPKVWDPLLKPVYALLDEPGCDVWRYWDERPQPVTTDHPDLPTIVYGVPGKQAVFAVVSYADADATANVRLDAAALGLSRGYRVVDVETGAALAVQDHRLSFSLKRHDLRLCRVEALP